MNTSGELQQPSLGTETHEGRGNEGTGASQSTLARPPIPRKPSFPAHLEGPRSKLIGMLAETFNGVIPGPKFTPQFDSWILIFGENSVHIGQVINSVLKDSRMLFPVLDTILTTAEIALLQQKWVIMGNPTKFIINARLPSGQVESSTFNQLASFIESKKRSWTERIYIIISTTMPADAICNGPAGGFKEYLYVPSPTDMVNLQWFAKLNGCYDTFDLPVNEEERLVHQSTDEEDNKGCLASVCNAAFSCVFFCFGECA